MTIIEHQCKPWPHCLTCGYEPVEGMVKYLLIHGKDTKCIQCGTLLGENCICKDPYQITGGKK